MGNKLIHQNENEDFLLKFYKENPDSIFMIGEWETELACASCGGSIAKSARCLYNQEFPTENTDRRNLALKDARCPHCLVTGEVQQVSAANSVFTPLPTDEVWFRKLVIDPPFRKVKKLFGYDEVPQEQKYIKEYRGL
jgi:hypothetical protein